MSKENFQYKLNFDPEFAKQADALWEKRGLSRTEAIKRIIQWFQTLPQAVQQSAFRQLPDGLEIEILKLEIERVQNGSALKMLELKDSSTPIHISAGAGGKTGGVGGKRAAKERQVSPGTKDEEEKQ